MLLAVDVSFVDDKTFSISAGEKYGLSCQFISSSVEGTRAGSASSFCSLTTNLGSSSSTASSEESEEGAFLLTFINQETKYFFDELLSKKEYYVNASDPIIASEGLVVNINGTRAEIELILQEMFLNLTKTTIKKKEKIILCFRFPDRVNEELERLLPLSYKGQRCMDNTDEVNVKLAKMASNCILQLGNEEDPDLDQLLKKMHISQRDRFFSGTDIDSKRRKIQPGNSGGAE